MAEHSETIVPDDLSPHGEHFVSRTDGALMALVPEGPFLMGSSEDDIFALEDEKPQRRVHLSAFFIDIYPVTNEQYLRFIESGGYEREGLWTPEGWRWREAENITEPARWRDAEWRHPRQPVAGVSWYEAVAYARWAGKDLPTDAQWEKAARQTDGRTYPWGEAVPGRDLLNFHNLVGRTTEVDRYPLGRSAYGCYDMAGNVNNWCLDWYWEPFGRYRLEHGLLRDPVLDDRQRLELGVEVHDRLDRGGGYATDLAYMRVLMCAAHIHWPPHTRFDWNGFRCVKNVGRRPP